MSNLRLSKRTVCQYLGYLYYSENLNWAAPNLQLGHGLDIVDVVKYKFWRWLWKTENLLLKIAFSRFCHGKLVYGTGSVYFT